MFDVIWKIQIEQNVNQVEIRDSDHFALFAYNVL